MQATKILHSRKALSSGSVIWKRRTNGSRDVFPVVLGDNYRTPVLRPSANLPPAALSLSATSGRRGSAIGRPRSVGARAGRPGRRPRHIRPSSLQRHRQFAPPWQASPMQDGRRRYAAADDSIFVHFILL